MNCDIKRQIFPLRAVRDKKQKTAEKRLNVGLMFTMWPKPRLKFKAVIALHLDINLRGSG